MALIQGWVRAFSLVSIGRLQRGVTKPSDLELAALAIRYTGNPSDVVIGALLDVPRSEIPEYIEREHRYELRAVQCTQLAAASSSATAVKALVCIESSDAVYRSDPSKFDQSSPEATAAAWGERIGRHYDVSTWGPLWGRTDILPAADYLHLCVHAAAELGGAAWANLLHGTLLADGRTRLGEYMASKGLVAHPALAQSESHAGAFALVGVNATGSSAGSLWPAWWRRAGSGQPPPPFLPCDAPPRPNHPEGRKAHATFMQTMVRGLAALPVVLVRAFLVTGAKNDAFDALASVRDRQDKQATVASVHLDEDACMLREVSTVVKHAPGGTAQCASCRRVDGHAYDLRACAAVVMKTLMELGDAVEAIEPGSAVKGYDCGWVDIAPAGAASAAAASDAAQPSEAVISTAPMCTVAGGQGGADDCPWVRHVRAFPAASCVLLGAGGACTALAVALLAPPGAKPTSKPAVPAAHAAGACHGSAPGTVHLFDVSSAACLRASEVLVGALGGQAVVGDDAAVTHIKGLCVPVYVHTCDNASKVASAARGTLQAAGAGSWCVNGTGEGKTSNVDPLLLHSDCGAAERGDAFVWPQHSVFWELNYRGPRPLLGRALEAHDACGAPLVVMDGWRLFHTGWMLNASVVARALAKEAVSTQGAATS